MLYRFLSSLKTSVYILVFLCVLFLIGTIFPQGQNIDDYIEAGGKYVTVVRALDFLDIFMSPLFLAATALLLLNLAVCLYDRSKIYLKIKRRPMDFQTLKHHAKVVTVSCGDLTHTLGKIGFTMKGETEDAADPGVIIFEKGVPFWWLSWFYHLGIILAITGFFLTSLFAFEKDIPLYPGEPQTISLYSKDTRWNRFREWLGLSGTQMHDRDNYELSLEEFRTEYYQGLRIDYPEEKLERLAIGAGIEKLKPSQKGFSYMPKMWLTRLNVKRPDGMVLPAEIRVNRPFRTGSLTLYQMGYEQMITLSVGGEEREVEARLPFTVEGTEGKFALGSLKLGTLFKRDGSTEKITPVTSLYHIPDGPASEKELIGELALGGQLDAEGVTFEFRDFREGSYLSLRKDPGVWLVGLACLFVFLGLIVRCLGAWYRIQCACEQKTAYVLISTRGILADRDRVIKKLQQQAG
jgi:cytochrome c biogenesis protein ResB